MGRAADEGEPAVGLRPPNDAVAGSQREIGGANAPAPRLVGQILFLVFVIIPWQFLWTVVAGSDSLFYSNPPNFWSLLILLFSVVTTGLMAVTLFWVPAPGDSRRNRTLRYLFAVAPLVAGAFKLVGAFREGISVLGLSQLPSILIVGIGVVLWSLGVALPFRRGRRALSAIALMVPPILALIYAQEENARTGLVPQAPSEPQQFLIIAAGVAIILMGIVGGLRPSRRRRTQSAG